VPLLRDDEWSARSWCRATENSTFSVHDQRLLTFVAQNIGTGLARQRDQQQLRSAHAELEKRVEERTRERWPRSTRNCSARSASACVPSSA
jgi:GAF domain-containing protein